MKDEEVEKALKDTRPPKDGWLKWLLAALAAGAAAACVAEWLRRGRPGKAGSGRPQR